MCEMKQKATVEKYYIMYIYFYTFATNSNEMRCDDKL